jgi:transposase
VRPDVSWQAEAGQGYDISAFTVDWCAQRMTCPQGKTSVSWTPRLDNEHRPGIHVKFSRTDCRLCAVRALCTRANGEARGVTIRPEGEHEALQAARQAQPTPQWRQEYNRRAGVEGTMSQGVRCFELRQARYVGLAKTHLQHVLTAGALNVVRLVNWLEGAEHARTRTSHFAALAVAA